MKRRSFLKSILLGVTGLIAAPVVAPVVAKPAFEVAANPTIRLSEIKARRFYIIDRAQIKAKEAIQREEDIRIFEAISRCAESSKRGRW